MDIQLSIYAYFNKQSEALGALKLALSEQINALKKQQQSTLAHEKALHEVMDLLVLVRQDRKNEVKLSKKFYQMANALLNQVLDKPMGEKKNKFIEHYQWLQCLNKYYLGLMKLEPSIQEVKNHELDGFKRVDYYQKLWSTSGFDNNKHIISEILLNLVHELKNPNHISEELENDSRAKSESKKLIKLETGEDVFASGNCVKLNEQIMNYLRIYGENTAKVTLLESLNQMSVLQQIKPSISYGLFFDNQSLLEVYKKQLGLIGGSNKQGQLRQYLAKMYLTRRVNQVISILMAPKKSMQLVMESLSDLNVQEVFYPVRKRKLEEILKSGNNIDFANMEQLGLLYVFHSQGQREIEKLVSVKVKVKEDLGTVRAPFNKHLALDEEPNDLMILSFMGLTNGIDKLNQQHKELLNEYVQVMESSGGGKGSRSEEYPEELKQQKLGQLKEKLIDWYVQYYLWTAEALLHLKYKQDSIFQLKELLKYPVFDFKLNKSEWEDLYQIENYYCFNFDEQWLSEVQSEAKIQWIGLINGTNSANNSLCVNDCEWIISSIQNSQGICNDGFFYQFQNQLDRIEKTMPMISGQFSIVFQGTSAWSVSSGVQDTEQESWEQLARCLAQYIKSKPWYKYWLNHLLAHGTKMPSDIRVCWQDLSMQLNAYNKNPYNKENWVMPSIGVLGSELLESEKISLVNKQLANPVLTLVGQVLNYYGHLAQVQEERLLEQVNAQSEQNGPALSSVGSKSWL